VFQILQSHGKINECIRFAEDVGAHEAVIVHYINKQEYLRALEKVERIPDRATKNTVMLRYASVFIKNLPEQTIIALSKFEDIKVEKLVPAFMNIPRTPTGPGGKVLDMAKNFVIDYCINKRKSKDKTVHNLALYFYAERDKPDDLLAYLRQQEAAKEAGQNIFFEIDYALNVCKQKEKELSLQLEIKKKYGSLSNQASLQLQA
jgi:poly-gamma-glutamate capsule biosynthesis protein CapA/YwtB (metallophosphatase superfamily)